VSAEKSDSFTTTKDVHFHIWRCFATSFSTISRLIPSLKMVLLLANVASTLFPNPVVERQMSVFDYG
jgi:hypothetical protein